MAARKETAKFPGCHGLAPWRFTMAARKETAKFPGCHGLVPWRFTLKLPGKKTTRNASYY
jgi:hypothetical protein